MEKWRTRGKKLLLLCAIYLLLFLTIFFSKELSEGVREGIKVALELVVPSMFLFLILSNAIIRSRARELAARPFRFLARRVFRIPERETAVVILSLVGGYPVGAKLLGDAVREGRLSPSEAERMLAYCVNCGPAFLVSGVGAALFDSLALGIELYLSQIAACLLVGFLSSLRFESGRLTRLPPPSRSRPAGGEYAAGAVLVVGAVGDAVRSMASICGFVVAFSSLLPVLRLLLAGLSPEAACVVQGFLEVTSGCNGLSACVTLDRVLLAAVFTAFGGVCVHLQVCAMLHGSGVRMKRFLLWRPLYTLVSAAVTKLLLLLTPRVADCISLSRELPRRTVSVSPAATVFLLLLGVMLLFFSGKSARMKKEPLRGGEGK